jgi:3-oxoacyl-[acyl-carrier-protein] synthase II
LNGIPISSTKGSHGHLLGAAGALETAIVLQGLQYRMLPPVAQLAEVDEEFKDLNIVLPGAKNCNAISRTDNHTITVLKNSFGFGGTNASLCFRHEVTK